MTAFDAKNIFRVRGIIDALRPFEADVSSIINDHGRGKKVLFEGAQGLSWIRTSGLTRTLLNHPIAGGGELE